MCKDCEGTEGTKYEYSYGGNPQNRTNRKVSKRFIVKLEPSKVQAMLKKRCVVPLPRMDLKKLQYDANGRIIVLNEDAPAAKVGKCDGGTRTSTITSNAYNAQYLDINENSADYGTHFGLSMPNKSSDTTIIVDDSQSSDDGTASSVDGKPTVHRLLCAPDNSGLSTETLYYSPPPCTNHFYGSIHSPAEAYTVDSADSSSDEFGRPPGGGNGKPPKKRRRVYSPVIGLHDSQTESTAVFYKTMPSNKLTKHSSSSTSGFDEHSFSSSHSSNAFKTPVKRESHASIRSYFATSTDHESPDASPHLLSLDAPPLKRRKSTPRKVTPPIVPPNQPTILDMFIRTGGGRHAVGADSIAISNNEGGSILQ